jgi:hypothetical protein
VVSSGRSLTNLLRESRRPGHHLRSRPALLRLAWRGLAECASGAHRTLRHAVPCARKQRYQANGVGVDTIESRRASYVAVRDDVSSVPCPSRACSGWHPDIDSHHIMAATAIAWERGAASCFPAHLLGCLLIVRSSRSSFACALLGAGSPWAGGGACLVAGLYKTAPEQPPGHARLTPGCAAHVDKPLDTSRPGEWSDHEVCSAAAAAAAAAARCRCCSCCSLSLLLATESVSVLLALLESPDSTPRSLGPEFRPSRSGLIVDAYTRLDMDRLNQSALALKLA